MNVTFPDNANIQILVLPPGATAPVVAGNAAPPVLLAAPARKTSRRRDVLFLCVGAGLCVAVLAVSQSQHRSSGRLVEPAQAARPSNQVELAPPVTPLLRPIPDRADSPASAPSSDPTEAVKRLLDQRPTVTPLPGAPAPSTSAPSAGGGSRNAFGMSD